MGDSLDFMRLPAGLGFPDWIRNLPLAILRDLNARAAEQGRVLYEAGKVEGLIWAKNQVGGRVDGVQVTVATLPLRTGLAAAASVLASAPRTWAELVADRPTPEATGALGLLVAGLHHLARGALECATCRGTCPHVFALVYEATRVAATSPRHLLRLVGSSLPELAEAVEAERSTGGSRWTDGVGAFASPADAKEVVETAEPGAPRPLPAALGGPAAEAWIEAVRRSCIEAGPDLLERLANRRSVGSVPVPPIGPAPFWRIDLQAVQKRMDRAAVMRWALHRVHVLRLWGWPRLDEAAQALFAPRRVAELSVRWSEAELLLALQVLPAGCFSASQLHLGKALGRSPVLDRELVTTLARLAPREALAAMSGWIRAPEPGTQDLERLRGVVRALPGLCGQPGAAAVADELFLRLAHGPGAAELRRRLFVQLGRVALAFARPELGELVASAFGAGEGPLCVRLAASLAPETAWAAHYPYLGQALEGFALDTLGAFLPKLPAKRFEPLLCGTPAGIRDLAKNPAGLVGPQRPELGTLLKAVLGARKSHASALWRPAIALVLATHWVEEPCLDDSTTAELVRIATPPVSPGEAWRQRLAEALATRPRAEVVDAIFARSLQARNVIDVVMEGNLLALCAALGWPELASLLAGGLGHQSGVVASRALLGVLALGPTAQDELGQLEFRPEEEFDPVFGAYCWLADPAAEVRLVEAFRATKGRVLTARAFELRSLPTPGVVAALDAALGETPADAGLAGVVAELQEVVNVKAPVLDGRGTVKVNAYFPNLSTRTEDGWDEEDLPVRLPGDPVLFGAGVRAGVESNRPALSGLDPEEEPGTANRAGKVGRNDPCPCGSGKKFKKCCLG